TAARQALLALAEEAERIRATVTALAISRTGEEVGPGSRGVLQATATVLTELAASIDARPRQRTDHLAAARHELGRISPRAGTSWQWADEALLGQLRSACGTAERLNAEEPRSVATRRPQAFQSDWVRDSRLTLRASLGLSSEAGRHAMRLAVVSAAA